MFIMTVNIAMETPYDGTYPYTNESKNPIANAKGSIIANFYQTFYIGNYTYKPFQKKQEKS